MKCPDDYNVILVRLPGDVLSVVRVDVNSYPTVYINEALSLQAKRTALLHELAHFRQGDFTNHATIYDAEKRACFIARYANFARSFRPLTDAEALQQEIAGTALALHAFGDPDFDSPLDMPEPMFDQDPPPPIHGVIDKGW